MSSLFSGNHFFYSKKKKKKSRDMFSIVSCKYFQVNLKEQLTLPENFLLFLEVGKVI